MEMSVDACWDCPVSLVSVAGQLVLLLCFAVPGAALQRFRRPVVRSVGWVLIVCAFGLAAMLTRSIPYWGILRPGPGAVFSRAASYLIMGAIDLVLVMITVVVFRRSRSRRHSLNAPGAILLVSLLACTSCMPANPATVLERSAPIAKAGKLTESVGIETVGGVFSPIIERGEHLPARKSQVFTTAQDDQDRIRVHVIRGVDAAVKNDTHVASFEIFGIGPAKRGATLFEVVFEVSGNGDISVRAKSLATQRPAQIRIVAKGPSRS